MKNGGRPAAMVGNEFVVPQPRLGLAAAAPALPSNKPIITIPVVPHFGEYDLEVAVRPAARPRFARLQQVLDTAHNHSVSVFAAMFLLVGASGILVANSYISARIEAGVPQNFHVVRTAIHAGFNMSVPASQLAATVQTTADQPITLAIGDRTVTENADTIRSWLQVVTDQSSNTSYIHVKDAAITASLQTLAKQYSKTAVNEVSATHDGATSVIAAGRNGLQVSVPDGMGKDIAKQLLAGKGMQLSLPSAPLVFQAITPAAFSKLIEVNVDTKQMWLYDNGNLTKTYPISAGKPSTPTPIGQYKIFEKLPVQDMKGINPDGTPYVQPHVHWINYFLPGGFAVHGVYWHPQSWFGVNNSSHGCVGLPDDQAKEVYDWAPLGTTVITHHS